MNASLSLIASLPMYDWPEQRNAHDQFWHLLQSKFIECGIVCPSSLLHDEDDAHWLNSNLLVGQTCGYPFATTLKNKVSYLATPVYDVTGCQGPYYSSALIAHKNNSIDFSALNECRFVFNGYSSLSGYRCVSAMLGEPEEVFVTLHKSGSHRASAKAVAEGEADIAAIDAVCWHLLQMHDPEIAKDLQVIKWTPQRPSLPFITSLKTPNKTRNKIQKTLKNFGSFPALNIKGFEIIDTTEYDALAQL